MASWKVIAGMLAGRLAEQVSEGCPVHGAGWRENYKECPYCADAQAYFAYLKAGGYDFRQPPYEGKRVSLRELLARPELARSRVYMLAW